MLQSTFQYQRPRYYSKLNLVALMDIFTILVFFLLLNTGEAENLENAKFVQLPNSLAGTTPHGELVILIDEDSLWLEEKRIASIGDIMENPEASIEPLATALADYRDRKGELNSYEEQNGLALTVMGDRAVPYGLLRSVMQTCRLENFRDIALAVNQMMAPVSSSPLPAANDTSPEVAIRATPGVRQ